MSNPAARHRKPARSAIPPASEPPRHRVRSQAAARPRRRPLRIAVVMGAAAVTGALAAAVAIYLPGVTGRTAPGHFQADSARVTDVLARTVANSVGLAMTQLPKAEAAGRPAAIAGHRSSKPARGAPAATARRQRRAQREAAPPVYLNPVRAIKGLIPERVDMGVDFGGAGPIYALGNAVITDAIADSAGWPGGGWITYQLTDGPAAGLVVYVAEDVTPTVQAGQRVTASTVIANMYNGGAGIETGWAMPDSTSAESQLPVAGGISGAGPFPTEVGLNFEELLEALGVVTAPNAGQSASGLLPSNYPASWSGLTAKS